MLYLEKYKNVDTTYKQLLKDILKYGKSKDDRTGVGTRSLFGYQMRFDLSKGFPILTTKFVPFRLIKSELLWFLHGDENIKFLLENRNHIWDEWAFEKWVNSDDYTGPDMTDFGLRAEKDLEFKKEYLKQKKIFTEKIINDSEFADKYGHLGPVYGYQWRRWHKRHSKKEIDQLANAIKQIKQDPTSRRIVVTAWNPEDVPNSALPPCHILYQFYVNDGKLSCEFYQR